MELYGKGIASNKVSIIVLGTYACTAGTMKKNGCKGYYKLKPKGTYW